MRDNNHVPTDLRKFVEFGGMACPVSNQQGEQMNQFLHDFGIRILRARRAAGLSQEKLGQMVDGVSRHCVWHWEAGFNGCSLERAAKIAKALNVSVGYLFGEVEHEVLDRRGDGSCGDRAAAPVADAVDKLEGIH